MAIPIQTPSLSELLAAYQNNGVANGINQASTNFNNAAHTASEVQAQRAAAAVAQQQTAIAQQQANTAEQERLSHIVSPEDLNAGLTGQPVNHPVNQTFADTILKAKQASDLKQAQLAQQAFEADENRKSREALAAQAAQVHKDATLSTAQTARSAQFEAAGKSLEGLHWYDKLFNTQANKGVTAGYNFAAGQVGAPGLNGASANAVYRHYTDGHSEVSTDGGKTFQPTAR